MVALVIMCWMAPMDSDDPCHDIFHCDSSLDCNTHIESEFYTSKIEPGRINICCHCAGTNESPVNLTASLKSPEGPYSIVLPICEECMNKGLRFIVRAAIQNAQAKQARLDSQAARENLLQEKEAEEVDAINVASSSARPFAPTQPSITRKRRATAPPASRRTRSNSNKRGKRV